MSITIERPKLTSYQEAILYNNARFTITEASTKAGKTFSHLFWLFEYSHGYENKIKVLSIEEGMNFWWVAPSHGQARIAFNRMRSAVRESGMYIVNRTAKTITTPLGTIIHFKTSKDADALYGEDVYACVFDEAPRAKYDAFVALRSTLTATRAPMKLIGNFGGVSNWVHQLKEKALTDLNYLYFRVTAWDAVSEGILEREEVEQAQRDLPPKVFKALYLAEAQESEDMLCSYDAIKDIFTSTHVSKGTRYITADIALQGSDSFVMIVWDGFRIIDLTIIEKCEADEVERIIKEKAEKFNVGRSNIVYDADGLGSFLRGYLKGAKPFNNGAKPFPVKGKVLNYKNLKTQCIYELSRIINSSQLFIDLDLDIKTKEILLQELECLQSYETDSDGKIQALPKKKIKELIQRSPDVLDALTMRMYFHLKPKLTAPRARVYD